MRFRNLLSAILSVCIMGIAHAEDFETIAVNAYVIDVNTGTVVLDKASSESMPPASTSKLMTTAVLFKALVDGKVTLDTKFHVSKKAWGMEGSKMFIQVDTEVRVEDLLQGILVQSGNDACVAVAEGLAGTEEVFAVEMNALAKELGLTDSSFSNSTGLPDPNQRMSAKDLAVLSYHLYTTYPQFWHYFSEPEFTWNKITQPNRNPLLGVVKGADGLKTGHTKEAGYSIVGSVERDNRHIIMVLMGMQSEKARAEEAERVATWALSNFESKTIINGGEPVASAKTWLSDKAVVPLIAENDLTTLIAKDGTSATTITAIYDEPIQGPLAKGTPVGTIKISQAKHADLEIPLLLGEDLGKASFSSRYASVLGEKISGFWSGSAEPAN